jgi:glycosyltransferase involved in cell wall biosynthesis
MKKVVVSVINDLVTDQRVHKFCTTLVDMNYEVLVVGRELKNSPALDKRPYKMHRMKLFFSKGPLFYTEFNIRLFFFLLGKKADVFFSNDLDTLLPNNLISKIKGKKLIYDSHEYFCYVPELINRPNVQKVWLFIERQIFPKLKIVFTVNDSIAEKYYQHYNVRPVVVKNVPLKKQFENILPASKSDLGLPQEKSIVILQGSGININRGAEEAVLAMKWVEDAVLLIIGGGDVIEKLKEIVQNEKLYNKVIFKPRMPFYELIQFTQNADIGLTLDKAGSPNYELSLPNKLFDYIHAGIPVLASSLVEIKKVFGKYNVGDFIENHNPEHIAEKINFMLRAKEKQTIWKENINLAAAEFNWENESLKIKEVLAKI